MSSKRFSIVLVLGIALTFSLTQMASAQRGQRRGFGLFGFGPTRLQLVGLEVVQTNLKLNDDQKQAANDISQALREEMRALRQDAGGDFAAMREKRQKANEEADAKLAGKLDEGQNKRLTEILVQVNGTRALTDKAVVKALALSEEQQKKLAAAQDENRQASLQAFRDLGRDASQEERREAFAKLRTEGDERLLAALTDAQREQFANMKGEEIEIDLTQLRGRRGGGRRQGGDGAAGRGRPSRPE